MTQQGHCALIRQTFGERWALLSAGVLFISCTGALVTEFAGVAGVGTLVGVPKWISTSAAALALITLVLLGRYRRVEHVGIAIGALELLFLPAAFLSHPHASMMLHDLAHPLSASGGFMTLLAANVGAVIMPWMIFYQQEAVIDKGRRGLDLRAALRSSRLDTGAGAVVTQLIMVAVAVATAATLGVSHHGHALNSIGAIATALTPFLGHREAVIFFGLGMVGASVVAALVVTLAGAWGMSEVLGWRHSLNDSPTRAAGFYGLAVAGAVTGAVLVMAAPNLVNLSVDVEVLNACLLPVVLGLLLALERRALPPESADARSPQADHVRIDFTDHRLRRRYRHHDDSERNLNELFLGTPRRSGAPTIAPPTAAGWTKVTFGPRPSCNTSLRWSSKWSE